MKIVLPQIVSTGIYNSSIAAKSKSISNNRKTTMFEIELPIDTGGISYIDSDRAAIAPDMIICAKPGQIRHTKFPFKCFYIHMILPDGDLCDMLMKVPNYLKTDKYDGYYELFRDMFEHYNTFLSVDEIYVQSIVLKLIHTLIRDSTSALRQYNANNSNYSVVQKAIDYINLNLTSDLSLDSLASYVCLSPIHFHNCFKVATGKTLHEYVEERRIKKAVNMLTTTNSTLTEIAYECGFSSQSYFSFVFKRAMKLTPREYVKKVLSEYEV